ncbi:hypothetical protein Tco_0231872 [Tanacetum coccineum]
MVDPTELSTSSGTPFIVERSSLDFSNEDAPPLLTQGVDVGVHGPAAAEQEILVTDDSGVREATVEPNLEKEVISMGLTIRKRRRQRDAGEEGSKAPAKVLRKDHDAARAKHSACGGKSLAEMSVDTELSIHAQETRIRFRMLSRGPSKMSHSKSSTEKGVTGNQDSERSTPFPPITGSHSATEVARHDQRIATREKHIKDLEAQLEAEINMKKAAEVKNSEVTKELEDLQMRFSSLEVGNAQLSQQISVLQAQVMGEKRIMDAFE